MLVQRFTETMVANFAATGVTVAAKANFQRIRLRFFPVGSGTALQLSTRPVSTNDMASTFMVGATNPTELSLSKRDDGILCCCEWYVNGNGLMGGKLCVLEVIEEDTGQPRSDGGVILSEGPGWKQDALGQIQSDTARMLLEAIRNAIPRGRNGRNENRR